MSVTALPSAVPVTFVLGSSQIYLFEPPLLVALLIVLYRTHSCTRGLSAGFLILVIAVSGGVIGGLAFGFTGYLNADIRPLLDTALAVPVIWYEVLSVRRRRIAMTFLSASLWISALLVALASASVLDLSGRTEAATLYLADSTADQGAATRVISSATFLALTALCGVVAVWLNGKASWRTLLGFALPSLAITFFAFSRNSVVGVGVAVIWALVWSLMHKNTKVVLSRLVVGVAVVAALVAIVYAATLTFGGSAYLSQQLAAYSSRVIGGLGAQTISVDPSAQYRETELPYLVSAIRESPFIGHGFGYAYKPPFGIDPGFFTNGGRFYAHNYYLWLTVKIGLLGSIPVVLLIFGGALSGLRRSTPLSVLAGASAASLFAICFVAPAPNDATGCLVAAALVVGGLQPAPARLSPHGNNLGLRWKQ